jgi:hypothetical protein
MALDWRVLARFSLLHLQCGNVCGLNRLGISHTTDAFSIRDRIRSDTLGASGLIGGALS